MAARRWLLLVVSLVSLTVLLYGGVSLAFSVDVTETMERASRLPGQSAPTAGQRVLVLPLVEPRELPTFERGAEAVLGHPGAILVLGDDDGTFPASAVNVSLARALVFVDAGNASQVTLADVPVVVEGNATATNLTLDLAALSGGREGFVVKPDAAPEAFFVPTDGVVGQVAQFESKADAYILLLLGTLGFVLPIVVLIMTHRPSGKPGIGPGSAPICPECRAPTMAGHDFCARCGAYFSEPRGR